MVEIVEPVISVVRDYVDGHARRVPDALSDPRVRLTIADGRHQMLVSPETYDVIVAEAIVPESAHSGLLFSIEFFRQIKQRLNPGGLCVEWAPTQRTIDTFRHVFPYVVRTGNALIGSEQPFDFSLDQLRRGAARPGAARTSPPAAGRRRRCSPGSSKTPVQRWTPGDPPPSDDINTDLFPKDEYFLNNGRRW